MFVEEWRVMKEVDQGEEKELSELSDVLAAWAGTSGTDTDMFS